MRYGAARAESHHRRLYRLSTAATTAYYSAYRVAFTSNRLLCFGPLCSLGGRDALYRRAATKG